MPSLDFWEGVKAQERGRATCPAWDPWITVLLRGVESGVLLALLAGSAGIRPVLMAECNCKCCAWELHSGVALVGWPNVSCWMHQRTVFERKLHSKATPEASPPSNTVPAGCATCLSRCLQSASRAGFETCNCYKAWCRAELSRDSCSQCPACPSTRCTLAAVATGVTNDNPPPPKYRRMCDYTTQSTFPANSLHLG